MRQECEMRQKCWEEQREKQLEPMREQRRVLKANGEVAKDFVCGYEGMGTIAFCYKRLRLLMAVANRCPSCGSDETKPYGEEQLICGPCGTVFAKEEQKDA